ncbi:kelch-like ECH-associated protein 1 [Platysternon megacephalum]|uniref:Kelch-like ECH-associated protein 1 n=1 Tax=Platysternon megacephalum TaxID=55544 RepID=A0A4D9DXV0_9SAUR|nr:kelch-like ECH-associated protein 1 [Platysternon megacephalum]
MLARLRASAGQSNTLDRAMVIGAQVRAALRITLTCSAGPGSPRTQPYFPGLCTRGSVTTTPRGQQGLRESHSQRRVPQRSAGAVPAPRTASSPAHRRLQGSQPGQPMAASVSKGRKVLMESKWRHPKCVASV